ncbi:FkbM family methyltransferase [Legionella spiritensis]|uniref:Methoxymalonyl CoA synthase n=1 Tax=Legionella spiritensis TaxID=452 RepID=A0A0W0Z0B3_LEGSP|nr:FkbM family methyltransferase [Legionella spiritensis]KTD62576.1 methoxymalonyl CoA synthase [Legionella spiritensis]SNV30573.1 methoxymalonyl CoA synthase [Legionella spiritensis]
MTNTIWQKKFSIGELYYVNELETRSLIYEIFYQNNYLQDYLTLTPGAVIFDVGANIGIFSLFAMQYCNNKAEIYSFEPIPLTFSCLQKNLRRFGNKIHLYKTGISHVAKACDVDFTLFGNNFATATYKPQDKIISNYQPLLNYNTLLAMSSLTNKKLYYQLRFLPFLRNYLIAGHYKRQTTPTLIKGRLISLGNFIEENQIRHIDLLKIDVEGCEADVIKSIKPHQFTNIKQLSIEVHDIKNRVARLTSYLKGHGYIIRVQRNPFLENLGFNHHMVYAKRDEK